MRLLVAPHELAVGGSQINAIDLAAGAAEAGHEVFVYGVPGPLVSYVAQRGLQFIPARRLRYRPAPSRIAQLAALARRHRLDLIHAYEWPPCLDAYYGAHLAFGVPLVCTVNSMSVSPLVPPSIPLVMVSEALGDEARRTHRAPVWVLEPPIDHQADHPGIDGAAFRRAYDIADENLLVVTVSRLAIDLKLDALVRAIDAVDLLAGRLPVQLLLVGGGPAEAALRTRAASVNARWGREVVGFTEWIADPGPAYAAADVVVGMGSSAMRAMSIGRPVVVQGERAFSRTFEPEAYPYFLRHTCYGLGDDAPTADRLAGQLEALLTDGDRRAELGSFGRRVVEERFSLARGVERTLEIYEEVLLQPPRRRLADVALSAARALRIEIENHDPRVKRSRRQADLGSLEAASRSTTHLGEVRPRAEA